MCFKGITSVRITNLNDTVNFHLPDHGNLSHQHLNITYTWDVQVPESKKKPNVFVNTVLLRNNEKSHSHRRSNVFRDARF